MNGILFLEDGTVQIIGQLTTVRLIAMKVQETIPKLVQQERDAIIESMTSEEIRRVIDMHAKRSE